MKRRNPFDSQNYSRQIFQFIFTYDRCSDKIYMNLYIFRYQKGITPHIKSRKVRYLCAFPAFCLLFELGVFFVVLNCICLSFMQIRAHFHINYIIYYGLLIFRCQNVAALIYLYNENHIEQSLSHYLLSDKQYGLHRLSAGSNRMPNHHLTFLAFLFPRSHSGQYPSTIGEYVLKSFYPVLSNIQNLPTPHLTMP